MAALAVAESTKFGAISWANFNAGMKSWAMREDQLSTTHSIQGTINDTDETFLNFDGITYGKGASVLKQLVHVLGMNNFRAGMRHYFHKFAWGNTTITDFLGALETAARENKHAIDLKAWSAMWLETAGINTIGAAVDAQHTHIVVSQTAPASHPTLRTHTIDLGLFDAHGQLIETVKANVNAAASTQVALAKKSEAAFLFPNQGDHGYFKIVLDPASLAFAQSRLETFKEALLRQLLWQTFYNMTRDAAMKSTDYLRLVREKLGFETDPKLIQTILDRAVATLANFVPTAMHNGEADGLFDLAWAALHRADSAELRIIWARSALSFAATNSRVERLVAFLDKPDITGFEFDQQMRWSVVLKAIAHGTTHTRTAIRLILQ